MKEEPSTVSPVTELLQRLESSSALPGNDLFILVYEELKQLAASHLRAETPGQTLQPTALVHEAWIKLVGNQASSSDASWQPGWKTRRHFFGAAAEAIRRILIDRARRRNRLKHGVEVERTVVDLEELASERPDDSIERVSEALDRLNSIDGQAAELVRLRYFAGLSLHEAADTLEIPHRTADRTWAYARAWLIRELSPDAES